jgi:hypothetical protein
MRVLQWVFSSSVVLWFSLQALLIFLPRKWLIINSQVAEVYQQRMRALPRWHQLNVRGKVFVSLWWIAGMTALIVMAVMAFQGETEILP